ncbi:MAG: hypothetical protein RH982_07755 [Parvibaculum sp.]
MPLAGNPARKKIFGAKAADTPPSKTDAAPVSDEDDIVFADEEKAPAPAKSGGTVADIGNRFRAEIRRAASMRRGKALSTVGWALLILFVAGTLGAGYAYRMEIAALWPATTKVYAAVGTPVNLRGLELRNVSYERQTEAGLPVLAVKGDVVNVSGERVVLPRLRVGLLDESQKELYHWTFSLPETELPVGEASSFITRLSSPPPEARDIEVRFVQKADVAAMKVPEPASEDAVPPDVPEGEPAASDDASASPAAE